MPIASLPIPEVNTTCVRPLILEVVRDVAKWTHLDIKTRVLHNESPEAQLQTGSSLQERADRSQLMLFDADQALDVQLNMEPTDDALNSGAIIPGNQMIWLDPARDIFLRPAFKNHKISLSISYRASSEAKARAWRDGIQARAGQNRQGFVHEPTYSYLIPEEWIYLLKELWRLRENVDGYGQTFEEYFEAHASADVGKIVSQTGRSEIYAKREKTIRVVGWFDFDTVPDKGSRVDNASSWEISFTYNFLFSMPNEMAIRYPIIMHNQLLSSTYRPTETDDEELNYAEAMHWSQTGVRYFEHNYFTNGYLARQGRAMPSFDDFHPRFIIPSTIRIVTALSRVSSTEVGTKFGNLSDFRLERKYMRFIKETEWKFMTKHYGSIFQLQLYINGNMMDPTFVGVDENLNIYAKKPLSLRNEYRVRFSLVTDLQLLDEEARDRLADNGDIFGEIIDNLFPDKSGCIKVVGPAPGLVVKNTCYEEIYGYDKRANTMRTVNTLFIITERGDGLP